MTIRTAAPVLALLFIAESQTNLKGAHHHLLFQRGHDALLKSVKAVSKFKDSN